MSRFVLKAAAAAIICAGVAAPVVWSQTASPAANPADPAAQAASPPAEAAAAALPGTAQLWQVTTQTTMAGQTPATKSISLCTGPDDLKIPPPALTGTQCPNQTFSSDGGTIKWVADCEAAKGSGSITVSSDSQSLSGDITDLLGNATIHVSGVVTGTCNKS